MTIQIQKTNNLPPLGVERTKDRIKIESDPAIKSLIQSKLLLNKDLNQLLVSFLGSTKKIDTFFDDSKNNKEVYKSTLEQIKKYVGKVEAKVLNKIKKSIENDYEKKNDEILKKINDASDEIQNILNDFEKKHEVKLNILESIPIYSCKNCGVILFKGRCVPVTCTCNTAIRGPSDCKNINIFQLSGNVTKFIESNMWLEYGIDYLLRKKNFSTSCGIYVLGHSGVLHEIDNVAHVSKEKLRLFCECKTIDIRVFDVFVFAGKMTDIGCTRGYIFTTSFDTPKDVINLARSRNITIIEQVLEKDNEELIKEIKENF